MGRCVMARMKRLIVEDDLPENITIRITDDPKLQKDYSNLKREYGKRFNYQDVCKEAIRRLIRDFKEDIDLVNEDIATVKGKINILESRINTSREDLAILQKELNDLEEWKEVILSKSGKGEDLKMRVINAVTRIRKIYSDGDQPSKNVLQKYSQETHLLPATLRRLGEAYYLGTISRKDLESLTVESIPELDKMEEFTKANLGKIALSRHQTTFHEHH